MDVTTDSVVDARDYYTPMLRSMLYDKVPRAMKKSAVTREGTVSVVGGKPCIKTRVTLDTGADSGSYIGGDVLKDLGPDFPVEACDHRVRLGDGKTYVDVNQVIYVDIQLEDNYGDFTQAITTAFYVVPTLGYDVIIGLPDILGDYFDHFSDFLHAARREQQRTQPCLQSRLEAICNRIATELCREEPRANHLTKLRIEAEKEASGYLSNKRRILGDSSAKVVVYAPSEGAGIEVIQSAKYGTAFADFRIEDALESIALTTDPDFKDSPLGSLLQPWAHEPVACPEEVQTPDPLAFGEDVLRFMEMSVEESRKEYLELLPKHVSAAMAASCPKVFDLLKSHIAQEIFAPSDWPGMKVDPAVMDILSPLPSRLTPAARPVRPALYEAAKIEFERLRKYFYVDSRSPIASPLVIAPKATAPFIRFCGDYREVNKYISIPQQPIPIVQHELVKAAKFKVYVDLDMANSFHQIPLSEEFSNLLSVQTPWGLVRPKFLPEGVGPASGLLQHLVREIFKPFEAWTIVIFDNFLVLADDYEDAYLKLEKVLQRCAEYGVILKLKKSFIGVEKVTFFGYEVEHGQWRMSGSRKDAIAAIPFPKNTKEMQSFLGAALFFHHHVPDYSEWSARLYEMTHADFVWDPGQWKFDYVTHFEHFKQALCDASTLYFPDYSLPWVLRVDASQHAVGAVLFQEVTAADGTVSHQPIAFSSKRFSAPATKWDAYKREAYAIFHGVHAFSYYLRGKHFLVETDHRNLQWIESSHSPIVVRWRTLLQSFPFTVRHIPGKSNNVADYLSRMGFFVTPVDPPTSTDASVYGMEGAGLLPMTGDLNPPTLSDLLSSVHGQRRLHFGAHETWRRAKLAYPQATISINAVRDWVQQCPVCQKVRDVGIKSLPEETLSLKPDTYRRRVGIDHLAIAPDKYGYSCVLMVVEHYSHLPVAYACKGYTADEVATVLFKHFVTYGLFDEIASDPGSAFMSEVVLHLNKWLGVRHKVSLVDRHESNGCEGSNRQFLRHLRALLADTRLHDEWSSDQVLPLINFEMASYPTSETGGCTPFQLKYGTQDAAYFRLPDNLEPGERAAELLRRLDANIAAVRAVSSKLQADIAAERAAADGPLPKYEPGDYVLWDSRSNPCTPVHDKRLGQWLGPYMVIRQVKNDITIKHLTVGHEKVVHTSRVRPFLGNQADAFELSKLDYHQWTIASINYWTGNVHQRQSLLFNVTFEDGETLDLPFSNDLSESRNFEEFVATQPLLMPLLTTAAKAKQDAATVRKLIITAYQPGDTLYVDLRYYDGTQAMWFDSLGLPPTGDRYMVKGVIQQLTSHGRKAIATIPVYDSRISLDGWDLALYCAESLEDNILVTSDMLRQYPQLLSS